MNVQFAVKDGEVYLIEVNPRASRTVPFVAKAIGRPVAKIAARVMAGEAARRLRRDRRATLDYIAVKESVFPFARFPGTDPVLGPEMKSTGEVMGIDRDFDIAFAKALLGAGMLLPQSGTAFVSVKDADKDNIVPAVEKLVELGFTIIATGGTADHLAARGLAGRAGQQGRAGAAAHRRPDDRRRGRRWCSTPPKGWQSLKDSHSIRATALTSKVPYFTTAAASLARGAGRSRRCAATRLKSLAPVLLFRFQEISLPTIQLCSDRDAMPAAPGRDFEEGILEMASADKVPMLAEGYRKLTDELRRCKMRSGPPIVEAIEEARAHGDLRENAEYHAAKERQGQVEATIADLEDRLSRAHGDRPDDACRATRSCSARPSPCIDEDDKKVRYQLVGQTEADAKVGRISYNSPLGRALIGRTGRRRGRGHDAVGRPLLRDQEDRVHLEARIEPDSCSISLRTMRVTMTLAEMV